MRIIEIHLRDGGAYWISGNPEPSLEDFSALVAKAGLGAEGSVRGKLLVKGEPAEETEEWVVVPGDVIKCVILREED